MGEPAVRKRRHSLAGIREGGEWRHHVALARAASRLSGTRAAERATKSICVYICVLCTVAEGTENNDNEWETRLRTHPQRGATRSQSGRTFFLLLWQSERSPFICKHFRILLKLAAPLRNSNNNKKT